jgi:thymidine kinase
MNSGKSTALLQVAHNYEEQGMKTLLVKPHIDSKGNDAIVSRLGLKRTADIVLSQSQTFQEYSSRLEGVSCIIIDEAQFLTEAQVEELFWITVDKKIPVIAYGIRSDFKTKGFPGSNRLLQLAHSIEEYKTVCRCGKKAIFNARKINDVYIYDGDQVAIDGENTVRYESMCGACYKTNVLHL